MKIKSIIPGAAIVLVATIGSVSAADQFTTIAGFEAQAMTKQEMDATQASFLAGGEFPIPTVMSDTSATSSTGTSSKYIFRPVIFVSIVEAPSF
jgi:Flp pilus assembly secretin CpaC